MSVDERRYIRKVVGVVEPHLVSFLKVLGVDEVFVVQSENDFRKYIREIAAREDVAVVITQRSLAKKYSDAVSISTLYPAVIAIPDTAEELKEKAIDVYRVLIRKFIGYEISLGV